ncbi:hypothetical protein [Actinomadura macrotermitis]|uniref:Uncharacterized protein n=1 Tax=Actinomadura macrotermitis TaxID=2585200 RepID=A0A7K0BSH2_9ACTN|nr:hypothetical protein [Actinomadura macrotermitis]MQY04155.1 hypothetical protein [Actinomadura macrotermitis]
MKRVTAFREAITASWDQPDALVEALSRASPWEKRIMKWGALLVFLAGPFALWGLLEPSGNVSSIAVIPFCAGVIMTLGVEGRVMNRELFSASSTLAGAGVLARIGAALAAEPGRYAEWREHLLTIRDEGRLALLAAGCEQVKAGFISRIEWFWRDVTQRAVRWVLRSNGRTWSLVACTIAYIVGDVAQTSIGVALVPLISLSWTASQAVPWLRDRLDAHPPKRKPDQTS